MHRLPFEGRHLVVIDIFFKGFWIIVLLHYTWLLCAHVQEKLHDSGLMRWMHNMIRIEIKDLLRHRALSKIVRTMQVKDLNLGVNLPVIESITPKKVITNRDTKLLDLVSNCCLSIYILIKLWSPCLFVNCLFEAVRTNPGYGMAALISNNLLNLISGTVILLRSS